MENAQPPVNQNLAETVVQQQVSRLLVVVVISVLVTAIVTGLIVFYWQKTANEKIIDNLEQKISSLEEQIAAMKEATTTTTTTTTLQPASSSAPSPTASIEPIIDWNAYTNKKFGYSLKYPHDWKILYSGQPDPTGNPSKYSVQIGKNNSVLVSITMLKSDQFQSFESLYDILNLPSGPAIITSRSETSIDGIRALYVIQNNNKEGVIFLDTNNNMITIEADSDNKATLNQILSTLKFTK